MECLWPADRFRAILERETARAHRYNEAFSLLVLDGTSVECIRDLEEALCSRIRATDEAGWLDQQHIGVILPDTPIEGAQKLADDLSEQLSEATPSCRAYTYPSQWLFVSRAWPRASA